MDWMDKLERKIGRYAIKNLMSYIIAITGGIFIINLVIPMGNIIGKIALSPYLVMQGEVWRLITYIFIPPEASPIWIIFVLYLYYMIGNSLEQEWGSFKFNLYYILGMIGTTIAVFITGGYGTATYLNLSLFLAFAHIYPDYEILLFFILPIKVKYLGWLNWAFIGYTILTGTLTMKVAAIVSIINFFVFFGRDFIKGTNTRRQVHYNRRRFQSQIPKKTFVHKKCTVCGLTQEDDPNMDFRYCSECDGMHAYCTKHIRNHEHIKENKVIEFNRKEDK